MLALATALLLSQTVPPQPVTVIGGSDLQGNSHAYLANPQGTLPTSTLANAFQPPTSVSVGNAGRLIKTADMDGDGNLDLVESERGTGAEIQVLYGDGKGGFPNRVVLNTGGAQIQGIAMGDFNGDGLMDVAGGGTSGSVFVFLATGPRTFGAASITAISGSPNIRGMDALRLTYFPDLRAGNVSLVFGSITTAFIYVLVGNGDGTFQAAVTYAVPAGSIAQDIHLVDLNIDGNPDVIATDPNGCGIITMRGHGDGTFDTPAETFFHPLQGRNLNNCPFYSTIADFNGDSMPDIGFGGGMTTFNQYPYGALCTSINLSTINANPIVFAQPTCAFTQGDCYEVGSGDFNHDGKLDIACANSGPGQGSSINAYNAGATLFLNNGNGGWVLGPTLNPKAGNRQLSAWPYGLVVGDFNNDGLADITFNDMGNITATSPTTLLWTYLSNPLSAVFAAPGARFEVSGVGGIQVGTSPGPMVQTPYCVGSSYATPMGVVSGRQGFLISTVDDSTPIYVGNSHVVAVPGALVNLSDAGTWVDGGPGVVGVPVTATMPYAASLANSLGMPIFAIKSAGAQDCGPDGGITTITEYP